MHMQDMQDSKSTKTQRVTGCGRIEKRIINNKREESNQEDSR